MNDECGMGEEEIAGSRLPLSIFFNIPYSARALPSPERLSEGSEAW